MSVRLDVPSDVKLAIERARVTAGNNRLTPVSRFANDLSIIQRKHQQDTLADGESKRAAAITPDGDRPRDDAEAQAGRMMTGQALERKLAKLNPSLVFQDSPFPGRRLIKKRDATIEGGYRTITAFEIGVMPEFSVLEIPKHKWEGEPREDKRGWRTVLGMCIVRGVLSTEQAMREFGAPSHDSQRWQSTVY